MKIECGNNIGAGERRGGMRGALGQICDIDDIAADGVGHQLQIAKSIIHVGSNFLS